MTRLNYARMFFFTALCVPYGVANAAEPKAKPEPLHIKIGAPQKSSEEITIIHGQYAKTDTQIDTKALLSAVPENLKVMNAAEKETQPHTDIAPAKISENAPTIKNETSKQPASTRPAPKRVIQAACSTDMIATSAVPTNQTKILADSMKSSLHATGHDPYLIDAMYRASEKTGVNFDLLALKAMMESDLGRITQSSSSSARGAFQFVDATWLLLIKRYGDRIGYAEYAHAINYDPELKDYFIESDSFSKSDILALRDNEDIATMIKSYQIQDEVRVIKRYKNGAEVNATDHYIVHMLGLAMAKTYYELLMAESPIILTNLKNQYFAQAIAVNKSFFYDANGNGLNAAQSYARFQKKVSAKMAQMQNMRSPQNDIQNASLSINSNCNHPNVTTVTAQAAKEKGYPKRADSMGLIDKMVHKYKISMQ